MKKKRERTFRRLISIYPKKHLLVIGVTISMLYSVITIAFGYLLKVLIDAAIDGVRDVYITVLYISIAMLLMNAVLIFLRTKVIGRYSELGLAKLREAYADSLAYMSFDRLEHYHSGELTSRGTTDMNRVRNFTYMVIPRIIEVPLTALLAFIVVFILSWQLTLFSLAMVPILVVGSMLLMKPIGPVSKKVQAKLGEVNTISTDFVKGVEVAKAYNLEDILQDKNTLLVNESVKTEKQLVKRRGILGAFSEGFSIMPFITTFLFGGYLVIQGSMSIGSLLAFINLLNFLTWPLTQMSVLIGEAKRDLASASRVFEIIDETKERTDGHDFEIDYTKPIIEFDGVSFTYVNGSHNVINDLSFTIHYKDSVAFVGPSGGGKSTLTKLILGYFNHYEGEIRVFGHDLREWNLAALREKLAIVSQESFLFPESIEENIAYGNPSAEKSTIIDALEGANAYGFVQEQSQGIHTSLGEMGNTLSGGQKQRLSIARAMIKNAPILLLDEATSALDNESEALIQETLDEILHNKTSMIIAHRLSTIKNVCKIFVLDQGRMVESGSHNDLLGANGLYAKLYLRQLEKQEGGLSDEEVTV